MVPWAHRHFGRKKLTFQQDSTPAHSESNAGVARGQFSRLHICGMASLLAGSQPYGLQHLVNFGGRGLQKLEAPHWLSPTKIGSAETVVAARIGPIVGGRVAEHGLEFSEEFDAVY